MTEISLKALAKINIGLDATAAREDGYHEIRTVMQTLHLYDKVEMKRTRSPRIRVQVNLQYLPVGEDNLAYRAAALIREKYEIKEGVRITLHKFIPVAAGLAGGSADAAAVLVGMNRIFKLGLSQEELMEMGKELGADVPFCVMRGTALAEGIGEKLTPLPPMPKCQVLIAKPAAEVSTQAVYESLKLYEGMRHPDIDAVIDGIRGKNLKTVAERMENILETVTVPMHPVIKDIKKMMRDNGAIGSLMSGSGPAVFGLFESDGDIQRAYEALKQSDLIQNLYTSDLYNPRTDTARREKTHDR